MIKQVKQFFLRALLRFRPYYFGVDLANGDDYGCRVYKKELFGKHYVIKIEYFK